MRRIHHKRRTNNPMKMETIQMLHLSKRKRRSQRRKRLMNLSLLDSNLLGFLKYPCMRSLTFSNQRDKMEIQKLSNSVKSPKINACIVLDS
jgi:hypothetical protein